MHVALRVDASIEIGTGHVTRCLTLADELAGKGTRCTFISRHLPGNLIDSCSARGFATVVLAPLDPQIACVNDEPGHSAWLGASWDSDAEETLIALADLPAVDWLIVDHYALDYRWQRRLRSATQRLLVIDDLADREHDCDLLLDQNFYADMADRYGRLVSAGCRQLIGPHYALLRPAFANHRRQGLPNRCWPVRSVLLFFGGVDQPNVTMQALQAVEAVRTTGLIAEVVVGPTNQHLAEIEDWCLSRPWARIHKGGTDMAALMAAADLAIGAGGTTTWERCCLGLPTIVIPIAENQVRAAQDLATHGAIHLVEHQPALAAAIEKALLKLLHDPLYRQKIAARSAELVDGMGAHRVLDELCTD